MSRRSTLAVSTLVPALNVLSTTLPVITFFSVVRTKAPPLPGLTCWNSVTDQRLPSIRSTRPFFRSFVVATAASLLCSISSRGPGVRTGSASAQDQQVPCRRGQRFGPGGGPDQGVLDPHAAATGEVHARLDGDRHALIQGSGRRRAHRRSLVDGESETLADGGHEPLAVARGGDDLAGRTVDLAGPDAGSQGGAAGRGGRVDQGVDLALPVRDGVRGPDEHGARHVRGG